MKDWQAIGLVSGLFVLITGLVAMQSLSASPSATTAPPTTVGSLAIPTSTTEIVAPDSPEVSGVGPEVQRVLHRYGNTEMLGDAQLAELPPEVVSVLSQLGVTLTIADERGGPTE